MRKSHLLLLIICVATACKKTNSESLNEACTDSCTTLQGRFITGNNEGIANIPFEIQTISGPPSGLGQTNIRRVATGTTDMNGYYSSTFSLKPGEYGQNSSSYLKIKFSYDQDKFLPVEWYENFGTEEGLGNFTRRDTTANADIYLTSHSKLKVRLENFVPLQAGDHFSVITNCGAGLDRRWVAGGHVEAEQSFTEKEIEACGNEQTTVIVRKKKNGITTSTSSTIYTPTGQTTNVTFTY